MAGKEAYPFTTSMLNKLPPRYTADYCRTGGETIQQNRNQAEKQMAGVQRERIFTESIGPLPGLTGWLLSGGLKALSMVFALWGIVAVLNGGNAYLPFYLFAGSTLLSILVGFILKKPARKEHERRLNTLDQQSRAIDEKHQQFARQTVEEMKAHCAAYRRAFDEAAVQLAGQMAGSPSVTAVAQWIAELYAVGIDNADRSSRVQNIEALFEYRVHRDHIGTFPGDTGPEFSFAAERLKPLSSPLEQAALARAIAPAVQLEIMMRYPTDPSGTPPVINITQSYDDNGFDYTVTRLKYTAPNRR